MTWLTRPSTLSTFSFTPDTSAFNYPITLLESSGTFYVTDITFDDLESFIKGSVYTLDPNITQVTTNAISLVNGDIDNPCGMVIDSSYIYVTDYYVGNIARLSITDGSGILDWCVSGVPELFSIVLYGDHLYASSYLGGVIEIDLSGNVSDSSWCILPSPGGQLFVEGSTLYVGCADGLYTVPLPGGGAPTQRMSFFNEFAPTGVTILGDYIYITNNGTSIDVYDLSGGIVQIDWQGPFYGCVNLYNHNGFIYVSQVGAVVRLDPYTPVICYNKGTKILCEDGYIPIEELQPGDLVKTYNHGLVAIESIKTAKFKNNPNDWTRCMYRLPSLDPEHEDLVVTGPHGILKRTLTRQEIIADYRWLKRNKGYSRIDGLYLQRAAFNPEFQKVTDTEIYTFYHFCLEGGRYGVWANGVLSESTFKKDLKRV